jgi:glutamate/tyrosine decarboxylase-like PLP-dependent enzyme
MERRTVRWLTDLVGYGPEAGGNLTSGGMTANFIALKLARDWLPVIVRSITEFTSAAPFTPQKSATSP